MVSIVWIVLTTVVFVDIAKSRSTQCDPSQTQLFYEDATDFTEWALDTDGIGYLYNYPTDICFNETCYMLYELDYNSEIQTPNFVSELISTAGYQDITITYALGQQSWSPDTENITNDFGECGTSYTTDGHVFAPIDSHVSEPDLPCMTTRFTADCNVTFDIITASLGIDASNTETLQIRWEMTSLWPFDISRIDNRHFCIIDEIRVCGTATSNPTSITSNPTKNPTRDDDDDDDDNDDDDDDDSSDSSDSNDGALMSENELDNGMYNGNNNNEISETITVNLSDQSIFNLWGLFGAFTVVNIIIAFWCYYQRSQKKVKFVNENTSPNIDL